MALTYYRSTEDQSAKADVIASGEVNALFPPRSALNNTPLLRKLWIEFDAHYDIVVLAMFLNDAGTADCFIFSSANDDDAVDDLTGNEVKYRGFSIDQAVSDTSVKVVRYSPDYIRTGDKLMLVHYTSAYDYELFITTVSNLTDNGDGTGVIEFTDALNGFTPHICSAYEEKGPVNTGDMIPIWVHSNALQQPISPGDTTMYHLVIFGDQSAS